MSSSPDTDLVSDTPFLGFERRRPDQRLIHYSDRGAISTELVFGIRAAELGFTRSFGTTGDCYHNADVESLWATLKHDLHWIYEKQNQRSRELLRSVIFDHIEAFCNPQRIQECLGYGSPAAFESAAVAQEHVRGGTGQHQPRHQVGIRP